ncbi:MAG: DHH family phosphoesterase [Candidatus Micrarchaeota archaeon]|nr:DHH family phosphoesterase [Candidatus Micrarchaeota archaeon]
MGNREKFLERCAEAREAAKRMAQPLVIHHYDCDGIAAGAIVASWLESEGKRYLAKDVRKVDQSLISSLKGEKEIIFADLGSGTSIVDELKGEVVIIDHHQPATTSHLQANPHHFGFDGGSEISAAGCAYFVFGVHADLGVVGAVGDIQQPFCSLNRAMLDEAVERGEVAVSKDLLLFGRHSRPLVQFLLYADEPFLPGLSGQEEACIDFLASLEIPLKEGPHWRTYSDLAVEEKKRLVSALAELLAIRASPEAAKRLTGEVFTLLKQPKRTELRDASEFATLLNACGRNNKANLGLEVCLLKEGAYQQASALLAEHRKRLKEGIEFAASHAQDFGKFILVDARGVIPDSIIGIVAGMLYPGQRKKPVLALSLDESGNIKLSTRGTRKLVSEGLNLGKVVSECSSAVGGAGGGHNIAAGATIPYSRLEEFICEFAKRL